MYRPFGPQSPFAPNPVAHATGKVPVDPLGLNLANSKQARRACGTQLQPHKTRTSDLLFLLTLRIAQMPRDQPVFGRPFKTVLIRHAFFHVGEMSGSVENADFLLALL